MPGSGAWVARKGGIDERAWQRRRFAKAAFTHVLAFSPEFLAPAERVGSPRIFVSHGTRDGWLPIERCSRRIVPQLERAGYEVRYREFDGATSSRRRSGAKPQTGSPQRETGFAAKSRLRNVRTIEGEVF